MALGVRYQPLHELTRNRITISKGEDEKLVLTGRISELQKSCEEMEKECLRAKESDQHVDKTTIEQMKSHVASKDNEIYNLQVNIS